jgi:hypothetical protein
LYSGFLPDFFLPSWLRTRIAIFLPRKIRFYFTRVGIPVNRKLRRPVIIFGSSPHRVGNFGRFSLARHARCQCKRGSGRGPGGASRPWRDIMRHRFFHRFASDHDFVGRIGAGIGFSERGSGMVALRKPGNHSGIQVVPADSVPPGSGRTPRAENLSVPFPPIGRSAFFKVPFPSSERATGRQAGG